MHIFGIEFRHREDISVKKYKISNPFGQLYTNYGKSRADDKKHKKCTRKLSKEVHLGLTTTIRSRESQLSSFDALHIDFTFIWLIVGAQNDMSAALKPYNGRKDPAYINMN